MKGVKYCFESFAFKFYWQPMEEEIAKVAEILGVN